MEGSYVHLFVWIEYYQIAKAIPPSTVLEMMIR